MTSEAVSIHRRLAELHPEAFLPVLAMRLNNLGSIQCELDLAEDDKNTRDAMER